jgi:LmbE family N-acetylglucosaminyl deacetylase
MFAYAKEQGIDLGEDELPEDFGTPDELITTSLDVSAHADRKRKALQAHASQGDSIFLLNMPEEIQLRAFSEEHFVRRLCRVQAPAQEDDLFAGLR